MRIAHKDYNFIFELEENSRGLLIVESPMLFRQIIEEMRRSIEDREEIFIFSENNKIIKPWEEIGFVINPMSMELNIKKVINKLYEKISDDVTSSELLIESNAIFQRIEEYAINITDNIDYELSYKDKIEIIDILKMLDVKLVENYADLTEKILEYIRVNSTLMGNKCFIFVNLNTFFSEYEIEKIYEFAEYNKMLIFLIESRQPDNVSKYTQIKIIDKDGCEISFDM